MNETKSDQAEAAEIGKEDSLTGIENDLIDLSAAASIVGVSAQTLRRMEARGKISSRRTPGGGQGQGHRRYYIHDAIRLARSGAEELYRGKAELGLTTDELKGTIGADDAAKLLGVSRPTLRRWEREGKIIAHRGRMGKKVLYNRESIEALSRLGG